MHDARGTHGTWGEQVQRGQRQREQGWHPAYQLGGLLVIEPERVVVRYELLYVLVSLRNFRLLRLHLLF